LDTSVFVQAHRNYYSHDICPGFWILLDHFAQLGHILSIDRVRDEIFAPDEPDDLTDWAIQAPSGLFTFTSGQPVVDAFREIQTWARESTQFSAEAKVKFAGIADGWVVAYAKAHGAVVVTQEVYSADVKKRIPIPNVCLEFDVTHIDTFEMLRRLGGKFHWRQT
jgi:hypothetical protein